MLIRASRGWEAEGKRKSANALCTFTRMIAEVKIVYLICILQGWQKGGRRYPPFALTTVAQGIARHGLRSADFVAHQDKETCFENRHHSCRLRHPTYCWGKRLYPV